MLNCGLRHLRLVKPREEWPNDKAIYACAGATEVLNKTTLYASTQEAIADLNLVFATTARSRAMSKEILTPREAAQRTIAEKKGKVGFLFGAERAGLTNDDVVLADAIVSMPLNPDFLSLNLSQAVLLIAYEWYLSGDSQENKQVGGEEKATKQEMRGLFEHLENELESRGFFFPVEKKPLMVRNLRNIFQRSHLSSQEVRTLRGVIARLIRPPRLPLE